MEVLKIDWNEYKIRIICNREMKSLQFINHMHSGFSSGFFIFGVIHHNGRSIVRDTHAKRNQNLVLQYNTATVCVFGG